MVFLIYVVLYFFPILVNVSVYASFIDLVSAVSVSVTGHAT